MSMKILTVDDSRTMRDMLQARADEAGYRVVQAVDGVHGLEVLERETPGRHRHRHQHAASWTASASSRACARIDRFRVHADPGADHRERRRKRSTARADAGATGWIVKPFDPASWSTPIRRVAA